MQLLYVMHLLFMSMMLQCMVARLFYQGADMQLLLLLLLLLFFMLVQPGGHQNETVHAILGAAAAAQGLPSNSNDALKSAIQWASRADEGLGAVQWQLLSYETKADGTPDHSHALYRIQVQLRAQRSENVLRMIFILRVVSCNVWYSCCSTAAVLYHFGISVYIWLCTVD
jgi:hypothetical protein